MTALQDALVRCCDCERTTALHEDDPAMCPECQGFQRIVRLG